MAGDKASLVAKRVNVRGVKGLKCWKDSTADSSGLQPRGRAGAALLGLRASGFTSGGGFAGC